MKGKNFFDELDDSMKISRKITAANKCISKQKDIIIKLQDELKIKDEIIWSYESTNSPIMNATIIRLRIKLKQYEIVASNKGENNARR